MGVFDSIKQKYEEQQARSAELKEVRGKKIAALPAEYMGGYGEQRKALGVLVFFERQAEFRVALNTKSSFTIINTDISDIAVEGKDEVNRRVTVTRLLTLGIFAFALKKKNNDKEAFVTLVLTRGEEAIFHVKNKSPMELKVSLSKPLTHIRQNG